MPISWTQTKRSSIVGLAAVLLIATLGCAFLVGPQFIRIGLIVVLLLLSLVVYRHSRRTEYECPQCHNIFQVSFFTDLLSPHFPDRKLLTCRSCGHTGFFHARARH